MMGLLRRTKQFLVDRRAAGGHLSDTKLAPQLSGSVTSAFSVFDGIHRRYVKYKSLVFVNL